MPAPLIHLHRIRAPLEKIFRAERRRDVADDKRELEALLDLPHGLLGVHGAGARGVDQKRRDPLFRLRFDFVKMFCGKGAADADRADAQELPLSVAHRAGMIGRIEKAVCGDKPRERSLCVDKR